MSGDGLYQRNYGIWWFRYKDTADSRWKEKSTGTKDHAEARTFKKSWDRLNDDGELPADTGNWTVAQACTRWVEQHTARLRSVKARANERSYLRILLRRLGDKELKSITLNNLKDYQATRSEQVRERPVNLELGILVKVLKEANLWRGSLRNYKRLSEPESEVGEALTIQQLQHLDTVAASRDTWQVAYYAEIRASNTGMRGGEIKNLRLGAIDLQNRRIRIMRKATKTKKGARWVELNQAAMAAIARLYRRAELLGATGPEHYLLPADLSRHTKHGDPLKGQHGFQAAEHQKSWDTAWRNLRKAAGMPKLRFHSLRHSYITMMAELGVPMSVTKAAVGHMSDGMTDHYTHIGEKAARQAVDMLDKVRQAPAFVDDFVDVSGRTESDGSKLLN